MVMFYLNRGYMGSILFSIEKAGTCIPALTRPINGDDVHGDPLKDW